MQICVFMHRFDDGGAERTTIRLLNELQMLGHEITLVIRYNEGPAKNQLSEQIKVIDMKLPVKGKLRKNIKNVICLSKIMQEKKYDLMLAILSDMSQVASFAKWVSRSKMPLVSVVHSTLSVEAISFQKLRHKLWRFFDQQYEKVITVSEAVRWDYIHSCHAREDKVVTVYNPIVDNGIFEASKQCPVHPWLEKERTFQTLVLAGRLSYPKNHPLMFEVLKRLRQQGDFRLILLGDGELREELQKLAKNMQLDQWIDFHGYEKNPYAYMAHCDCVVLSSRYEGLPTVLVEAMACGSRIVSTDCPSGPAEILENGKYGVLVENQNADALAEGIMEALESEIPKESLRMRSMDFTVQNAVRSYERELQTVALNGKEN